MKDHGKEVGCVYTREPAKTALIFASENSDPSAKSRLEWYEQLANGRAVSSDALPRGAGAVLINARQAARDVFPHGQEELSRCGLLVLLPFGARPEAGGLLVVGNRQNNRPDSAALSRLELLAESVDIAVETRRTQVALGERIKELTCLYRMALLAEEPGTSLEDLLRGVAELLPDACLYPAEASARIDLDGVQYEDGPRAVAGESLKAEITVLGACRGFVELEYGQPKPRLDYGPFLREEKSLLDTVAREIALLVERKQREAESHTLEEQLHHADRLATIGELAAGFAHELNEPLANILGFAQLAGKGARLPKQTRGDIDKIVQAALHARGLTQQLLLFARRMPQNRAHIDLNAVVTEALRLLEPLFSKEGVEVVLQVAPVAVTINADPGQMRQVIVNLAVNAVQSMPNGGRLTIGTCADPDQWSAILTIDDSGIGMSQETLAKIFLPFFTTKEAGRGTGLGLAVVHGIVTSHGGRIEVNSQEDIGTRFSVFLPLQKTDNPG
jgi:two-component system, NtrC family, sensor kinase